MWVSTWYSRILIIRNDIQIHLQKFCQSSYQPMCKVLRPAGISPVECCLLKHGVDAAALVYKCNI